MDIVKQHLFAILCGVAGVAGIALGFTGLGRMSRVTDEMEEVKRLNDDLLSLRSNPVNQRWIDQEEKRIDEHKKNYKAVVARAQELYPYKPFLADVFPSGASSLRNDFRRQYRSWMDALMAKLKSGQPPTSREIMYVEEEVAQEQAQLDYIANADNEPDITQAGVLTASGAARSAAARAAITKAHKIYCYATALDDQIPSLHFHPGMADPEALDYASPTDCWFAQVHLWIQTDVVDAIARVNNATADRLIALDVNPWVGVLPIKEIISLRVSEEYIVEGGKFHIKGSSSGKTGDRSVAYPPEHPDETMSGSYTDPDARFQVLYFTLKVVMDQRQLPRLIQEICNNRFHSPLRVSYEAVKPNPLMTGRIYGSDPVVYVVMDFETHMLGKIFSFLMPEDVYFKYYPEE